MAINSGIPTLGISVRAPKEKQEASVFELAQRTAEHLGVPGIVQRMFLDRHGYLEEAFFTYGFSPIRGTAGLLAGPAGSTAVA